MGRVDFAVPVVAKLSKSVGTDAPSAVPVYDRNHIKVDEEEDQIDLVYSYVFSGNYFYHSSSNNNKNNEKRRRKHQHQLQQLPPDIQAEIMVRLPATSILRLRSVCHDWYDMSHEPSIIVENLAHANKGYIAFHPHQNQFHLVETNINRNAVFRLRPLPQNMHIIGSCNGILCLGEHGAHRRFMKRDIEAMYLYNPLLGGEYLVLPQHQIAPTRVVINYGFFFDHVRSDFKVVMFVADRRTYDDRVTVSIDTCSIPMVGEHNGAPQPWKIIKTELYINYYLQHSSRTRLVMVNGKLHLLLLNTGKVITSFDIATEEITSMPLFFVDERNYMDLSIGELGGRLFVTYVPLQSKNRNLEMWVMEDYNNPKSWSKRLSLRRTYNWSRIVPYMLNEDEIFILHGYSPYMVQHTPSLISLPSAKPITP